MRGLTDKCVQLRGNTKVQARLRRLTSGLSANNLLGHTTIMHTAQPLRRGFGVRVGGVLHAADRPAAHTVDAGHVSHAHTCR